MNAKSNYILAYEWSTIQWHSIECQVYKLQKRIYQASKRDDKITVHKLQKLLLKSKSARLLAVRRVTQDNQGKKTAGIDGKKSLLPKERLELASTLNLNYRPKAVRRIYIPKSNSKEKRPLGIPTIHDRAVQALAKLALEPEWEAKFEPNSFGFRPARCAHDAVMAIFNSIKQKSKFVLDADIEKCFDKINHDKLLKKLNTFPSMRRLIKGWLKAGIIENNVFYPSNAGTPQGGVISPLLANIALHGMEFHIKNSFPAKDIQRKGFRKLIPTPSVIRYADDFVIIHPDLEVVKACQVEISNWLKDIGLNLKESKTSICHTLDSHQDKDAGFDFLGFNIRQYPVSNKHSGKCHGKYLGFKNVIKPSKKAQKKHLLRLREVIRSHRASPQAQLIHVLNPIIIGWCNYYNKTASAKTFSRMDAMVFQKLRRWAFRRHNKKSRTWTALKYWRIKERGKWDFGTPDGKLTLAFHRNFKIKSHIQVKGTRSPYDGDWTYWGRRLQRFPLLSPMSIKLLKRQQGICNHCELYFKSDDLMEQDHIIPRTHGGTHRMDNLQLLHRHCHHQKSAKDRILYKDYPNVKNTKSLWEFLRINPRGAV